MKRRLLTLLLVVSMIVSMMPMTSFAEDSTIYVSSTGNDSNPGTEESPVTTFARALELVQSGGTIQIVDTAKASRPSEDFPLIIDKAVIIQGGTLDTDYAGIILGADATFKELTISFNNNVRNCIIANGYSLNLNNVKHNTTPIHIFAGGIDGYTGSAIIPTSGEAGQVVISGAENQFGTGEHKGNIYAGSLSEYGAANAWDKSASITIEPGAKGFGDIYAHGATEPRGEGTPYDMQPDSAKYKVSGDVTISISNTNNTVDCDTGNSYATLCYESDNANQANPKLLNVGNLILNGSSPNLAPAEGSTILSTASVTVPNGARLDLSNLTNVSYTDNLTINDFNGGGTISLKADQILSINGDITNQTSVVLQAIGDFIQAEKSKEDSFIPENDMMVFNLEAGLWTAEWAVVPIMDFNMEDTKVTSGAMYAYIPTYVDYEGEGSWFTDFAGIDFGIRVNGNVAGYDDNKYEYVDSNTGLQIYTSGEEEAFIIEKDEGLQAGIYEIEITVPADNTLSDMDIIRQVTLIVVEEDANCETHDWQYSQTKYTIRAICKNNCGEKQEIEIYPVWRDYDRTARDLINIVGNIDEVTMKYALGDNTTTAPITGWAEDIPDAINAGTYYVWMKADGIEELETICIESGINKVVLDVNAENKTALIGETLPELTYTITGFVEGDDVSAITGEPVLTYDEGTNTSEEGCYLINVDCSNMRAVNYAFNEIFGTLTVREHFHELTGFTLGTVYAENDSIFATCALKCTEGALCIVTIIAPENPIYSEGLWHTAALYGETDINLSSEDILYTSNGQTTEPVEPGTYTASITYEGMTASVTYTIVESITLPGGDGGTGGSISNSGGGSGGSSGSQNNSVDVDISTNKNMENDTVVVDLSKSNPNATAAKVSTEVLNKISEAAGNSEAKLEVILKDGVTIELSVDALYEQIKEVGEKDVEISILSHENAKLTKEQKKEIGSRPAYDITIASGGKNISNIGSKITIKVPYELKEKEKPSGIVVCHVDEQGKTQRCKTTYDWRDRCVKWQTDHLSLYMIDYVDNLLVACDRLKECPGTMFTDVNNNEWYHEGIHYCVEQELMKGVANNTFSPEGTTSRGQVVTMLWRLEGKPAADYSLKFEDVGDEQWYTEAVRWAASKGIVKGYNTEYFGVNDAITREQMVIILYRYSKSKGLDVSVGEDTNILSYDDALAIQEWVIPAMQWACGSGVIDGIKNGESMSLKPDSSTSRAQIATILWRFCDNQ